MKINNAAASEGFSGQHTRKQATTVVFLVSTLPHLKEWS
jgi:hypothetical protein